MACGSCKINKKCFSSRSMVKNNSKTPYDLTLLRYSAFMVPQIRLFFADRIFFISFYSTQPRLPTTLNAYLFVFQLFSACVFYLCCCLYGILFFCVVSSLLFFTIFLCYFFQFIPSRIFYTARNSYLITNPYLCFHHFTTERRHRGGS